MRYYDTAAEGGIKHAEEILDYIEDQWKKTKVGRFQRKDWTCVGSTKSQLPEQGLTNNCGVYTLMIAQLVHKELPLSALTLKAEVARKRIAFFLATGKEADVDEQAQTMARAVAQAGTRLQITPVSRTRRAKPRGEQQVIEAEVTKLSKEDRLRVGDYSEELNADKLFLGRWTGAGIGLFTRVWLPRQLLIGYYSGKRISREVADTDDYISDDVLDVLGQVVDAWDAGAGKVTCLTAFINDSLDLTKVNVAWCRVRGVNGSWVLGVRALRDIAPGEQLFAAYGVRGPPFA